MALDGDIELLREGFSPVIARSVFVPAGARHLIRFRCRRIACLYTDVASTDAARLGASMSALDEGYACQHRSELVFGRTVEAMLDDRPSIDDYKSRVAAILDLERAESIDPRVRAALKIIHQAPGESHRARALARTVGISESAFRKAFRAATGVPLKRYRVWARVNAAMKAAQEGESLTAAAHSAGFSSSAHLSVAYRNMFGMTPSAFLDVLAGRERQHSDPRGTDNSQVSTAGIDS